MKSHRLHWSPHDDARYRSYFAPHHDFAQVQGGIAGLPIAFQNEVKKRMDAYYQDVNAKIVAARTDTVSTINDSAKTVDPDGIRKLF